MNELNFSNYKYKKIALNLNNYSNIPILPSEAFFLLINGISKEDLYNLCVLIHKNIFYNDINISVDDCYNLTQNINLDLNIKEMILNLAYECISQGKDLGIKTINDGKINTSSWISHSLHSAKLCNILANIANLEGNKAQTLALLHDYGRKYDHSLNHTIKGFEELVDKGLFTEASACLTHSFVKGGRCSNNEPALDGFYVDDFGNPYYETIKKDDMLEFLQNYKYNKYDLLLNITDLMATSYGITSPYERIKDISTRRKIDPINRGYFLADVTNLLIFFLKNSNLIDTHISYIKADKNTSLEKIEDYFYKISYIFYNKYKNYTNMNRKSL